MVTAKANVNIIHNIVPSAPEVNYEKSVMQTVNPLRSQFYESTTSHTL